MSRPLPILLALVAVASSARAQGLVWSLPPDGTWVRYEGTYQQVMFDPTSNDQLSIADAKSSYDCNGASPKWAMVTCWQRSLWIRSVGTETATIDGNEVPCRWLEFEVVTGQVPAGEVAVDPGPIGTRLLKVLVPEAAVIGRTSDDRGIPVAFLPIVKGMQKMGEGPVTPLQSKILQLYPTFSLVTRYRSLDPDAAAGPAGTVLDAEPTTAVKGEVATESTSDRSTNTAVLWKSDKIPFGIAAWNVTIIREKKEDTAPRSTFQPRARIRVDMKATETGTDATSKLDAAAG